MALQHFFLIRETRMAEPQVVERASEDHDAAHAGRETAADFYTRICKDCGTDNDLDVLIRAHRSPHTGAPL